MGQSSIHIQKASAGAIAHNSRESYSKSVVFKDENNELWNTKKEAYDIYKSELSSRVEAYTNRTNQKLQKTAVTHLSAVVNLEQHHTMKDLENIKEELEKVFDTKVFQMAIHRDEGKLKHKTTGEYLVSGTDFFYNEEDNKYYAEKKVLSLKNDKGKEKKHHVFVNELDINDYIIEKNYHAHIELMGLDSNGNAIRQKMNRFVLSKLQDFTAQNLQMERGKNYLIDKSNKRLDTHEFKAEKKLENEIEKETKKRLVKQRDKIQTQVNEYVETNKKQKNDLKKQIEELNEENKLLRAELQIYKSERTVYAELEALNKKLKNDLESGRKNFDLVKQELETFKDKYLKVKNELHLVECKGIDLLEELEEIKLEVFHPKYKTESGKQVSNKTVANFFENELNKKDLQILDLKKENKSLEEQKKVLGDKVITLQEKINPRANMSDYEDIKKENETLKKENQELKIENRTLKEKIKSILSAANEKIKELFKFKIFNDVKFGNDGLDSKEWDWECDNDIRLASKYQVGIRKELIQYQEERDISKSKLDDVVDNQRELFQRLEKAKEKLNGVFGKEQEPMKIKKQNIDYSRDYGMHR